MGIMPIQQDLLVTILTKEGILMSKEDKEVVIKNKKEAIKSLNNLLEYYINDPSGEHLKKANLISYWLKTFTHYIKFEESFESKRLIRYKRGDVIRLNFGFNVGKEFGGLHYAVVIDNDNKRNADVLTVVPLSSTDGREIHSRSVDLGSELYKKVYAVQKTLLSNAQQKLNDLLSIEKAFDLTVELLESSPLPPAESSADIEEKIQNAIKYQKELTEKKIALEKEIEAITRNNREISKLKIGSMAITNQITTISKQRIYTPKRSEDFLYGISLSTTAMEKINNKLKELYIHS